jgi:ATP-dependent DNA helicase RecG
VGESLAPLSLDKLDQIRNQSAGRDWSAVTIPDATLGELDPDAVRAARQAFARKRQNTIPLEEVLAWPIEAFAERIKITEGGRLTRAGILLLGRAESAGRLSPNMAQMTWKLVGPDVAYEHFGPPLLLSTDRLYSRIRNIQVRLFSPTRLIPEEVSKYDKRVVLEALHNAIAHQRFDPGGRVVVTEFPDRLEFVNVGSFFDGSPEDYVLGLKTPSVYRNPRLVQVMAELNMMDTIGLGIHMMNARQVGRFLPLPDYDLSEEGRVKLTVYGSVVDQAYTDLLMRRTDLPLDEVLALDRVQKGLPISDGAARRLRRAGLVEGRRPNLSVAASVADATGRRADYIRRRAQDDSYHVKLILDYLDEFGSATRAEINDLLIGRFGEVLSDEQALRKVGALLTKMRLDGRIHNTGSRSRPSWRRAKRPIRRAFRETLPSVSAIILRVSRLRKPGRPPRKRRGSVHRVVPGQTVRRLS